MKKKFALKIFLLVVTLMLFTVSAAMAQGQSSCPADTFQVLSKCVPDTPQNRASMEAYAQQLINQSAAASNAVRFLNIVDRNKAFQLIAEDHLLYPTVNSGVAVHNNCADLVSTSTDYHIGVWRVPDVEAMEMYRIALVTENPDHTYTPTNSGATYSRKDAINRLKALLQDNCPSGIKLVSTDTDGTILQTVPDLQLVLYCPAMAPESKYKFQMADKVRWIAVMPGSVLGDDVHGLAAKVDREPTCYIIGDGARSLSWGAITPEAVSHVLEYGTYDLVDMNGAVYTIVLPGTQVPTLTGQ